MIILNLFMCGRRVSAKSFNCDIASVDGVVIVVNTPLSKRIDRVCPASVTFTPLIIVLGQRDEGGVCVCVGVWVCEGGEGRVLGAWVSL